MKVLLLTTLLLTSCLAFVPQASATCEPLTEPEFCAGPVEEQVDRVEGFVDRLRNMECWSEPGTPPRIYCRF